MYKTPVFGEFAVIGQRRALPGVQLKSRKVHGNDCYAGSQQCSDVGPIRVASELLQSPLKTIRGEAVIMGGMTPVIGSPGNYSAFKKDPHTPNRAPLVQVTGDTGEGSQVGECPGRFSRSGSPVLAPRDRLCEAQLLSCFLCRLLTSPRENKGMVFSTLGS